ncbi:hypothetical protein RRG08_054152 [Elysia crispata]|uniref:Uncharacterized protein n=1 Tax=Elysia crispata TaxID=231223 RepID=A0AAE0Y7C9_9GAST|nr:hypothetical protein RRG08_054152 [Elysia crispata]
MTSRAALQPHLTPLTSRLMGGKLRRKPSTAYLFLLLKSNPASSARAELDTVGGKPSRMYSLYQGDRSKPTGVLFLFFLDCKATGLLTGLYKL